MTRITELQIVYQKPVDLEEYGLDPEEMESEPVFATPGQSEVLKLARVGLDEWVENTLDIIPVEIPVGAAGSTDMVRRTVIRRFASREEWDREWKYFYVIAKFENRDETSFFRTVIPRTAISAEFRNLRRGKHRHR